MRRSRVEVRVDVLDRDVLEGVRVSEEPGSPRAKADLGVVLWFKDERPFQGLLGLLDWRRDGGLSSLAREGFCRGEAGESVLMPAGSGLPVERLALVGCGSAEVFDEHLALAAGERAAQVATALRPTSVLFAMPAVLGDRDVLESVFLGRCGASMPRRRPIRPR